jgi:Uma2 family endonuclease
MDTEKQVKTINLKHFTPQLSDRDLEILSKDNPDARLETNSIGQLIFMSPTGGETGYRNLRLAFQIELWNSQTQLGKVFDSSTGFKLSNGAVRSPDVSWIPISKWNALSREQRRKFLPIDPDFVIELMSPTDELRTTQQKMEEYMSCGVKLGWLINPDVQQVEIYRIRQEKEVINNPISLSGEDILPGLTVDLTEIFN